jgi:hypothetical protein
MLQLSACLLEHHDGAHDLALNSKLFDRSIYDSLMRKQVDVWSAIRNKADHGR